jgi:hypothetical protein
MYTLLSWYNQYERTKVNRRCWLRHTDRWYYAIANHSTTHRNTIRDVNILLDSRCRSYQRKLVWLYSSTNSILLFVLFSLLINLVFFSSDVCQSMSQFIYLGISNIKLVLRYFTILRFFRIFLLPVYSFKIMKAKIFQFYCSVFWYSYSTCSTVNWRYYYSWCSFSSKKCSIV